MTTSTLKGGDVIYPLISTNSNWQWGGLSNLDIKFDVSNPNAIEYKYGII